MILTLLQVALGGALGASARYLTGVAMTSLMGVLVVVLANLSATRLAPLFAVGFLGGFTTFSSFSLDVATLYERGDVALALGYVAVSVAVSIAALFAGLLIARNLFA